ncbi:MAG: hypothetical protein ACRC17_01845 [Culicoidibacterales bacterium]
MSESIQEVLNTYHENEYGKLELITELWTIIIYNRNFSSGEFEQTLQEIETKYPTVYEDLIDIYDQEPLKNPNEVVTEDEFEDELVQLKNNFALERIENLKRLGVKVYSLNGSQHLVENETDYTQPKTKTKIITSEKKTVGDYLEEGKQFVKKHKGTLIVVGAGAAGAAAVGSFVNNSRSKNQNQIQKNKNKRKK